MSTSRFNTASVQVVRVDVSPFPLDPRQRRSAMLSDHEEKAHRSDPLRARLQEQIGGDVRLLQVLGANGPELLVRARDVERKTEVVLKLLAIDSALAPDAHEQFEREAATAARLQHPNIVSAGPLERLGTFASYAVNVGEARTLESLMAGVERLPFERSIAILREVASALDYAHAHNVVHGGLVPAMIFVPERGEALVSGFGVVGGRHSAHSSGSPAYMAPEQWHDHAELDGHADLYALGVIAFELITGKRRLTSSCAPGVVTVDPLQVTNDVPLRPGLPLTVNNAILRAVSKRPANRFATAGEFVAMLEEPQLTPVQGLPTQRPEFDVPRLRRFGFFPMVAVALVGVFLGVLAVPSARKFLRRSPLPSAITGAWRLRSIPFPFSSSPSSSGSAAAPTPTGDMPDNGVASHPYGGTDGSAVVADSGIFTTRVETGDAPLASPPSTESSPAHSTARGSEALAPSTVRSGASAPSTASTGFVRVELNSASAAVLIDGVARGVTRGSTPFVGALPSGAHSISLLGAQSFQPARVSVVVRGGDTAVASFSIAPSRPR